MTWSLGGILIETALGGIGASERTTGEEPEERLGSFVAVAGETEEIFVVAGVGGKVESAPVENSATTGVGGVIGVGHGSWGEVSVGSVGGEGG